MPTIIIKTARDRDQYIAWSTIVEGPLWIGSRDELARYIATQGVRWRSGHDYPPDHAPEERLRRADQNGTSDLGPGIGTWDDHGLIYMQRGVIPRDRLWAAADWWTQQDSVDADLPSSFMVPFDDETPVREPV